MPTDSRRIAGPESSTNPYSFCTEKPRHDLLKNGKRQDGRKENNLRPIFLKAGVVSQARGSAYIEQNETKVICAVYGPREVVRKEDFSMKGLLTCEFKFAIFSCRERRQHQQDIEEKDYSVQLLEALEPAVCLDKFPKAQMNIYVTVLQNDGSALAAAITCASVAMADSGIEMYDLVAGCAVRVAGKNLLMDPCNQEEYKPEDETGLTNSGSVTVGLMPSLQQVSAISSKGEIEFELVKQAVAKCVDVCTQLYPVLQQALVKSVSERQNEEG
ncbi:hypothetical protein CHS0354_003958 [Potamilus streckersoni]|uniref:Exosome complex component MTR3 n=1 Tax=Potamilus streckersoni TaxID=2493646 RepID=A0AAE0W9E5_9BIVA|nr:hypothetical protein CHS0354_003958 [Potamilus streckersoni]